MKKLMMIAVAVLFGTVMFAQTPQKPAEKKEPAKMEKKTTTAPASSSTAKPADKKHPMHHNATTTGKSATAKPAGQKEATKPAKN